MLDTASLPSHPFDDHLGLPMCAAIYFVLRDDDTVLYVGRAVFLRRRWASHEKRTCARYFGATRLAWLETPPERLEAEEARWIDHFKPVLNWFGPVSFCQMINGEIPPPLVMERSGLLKRYALLRQTET